MQTIDLGGVSVTRIAHFGHWPLSPAGFFPGTDPRLWQANRDWLAPAHWDPQADRVRVDVQTWLLRSAGRTILVDTGLSPDVQRPGVPAGRGLPAGLAAAGVAAPDVDLVVCTHLHADHIGWNTRVDESTGLRVPAFPNARYLFSRPDIEFFRGRDDTFAQSVEPVIEAGQAVVWDDAYTIDEHLRLSLAPGHTPGLGVLTLQSRGERAVFVGDLLHSPAQVLEPEQSSCFCHDPRAAARSRRAVLEWAADHTALVVPAHFGGQHAVQVARTGPRFTIRGWAGFGDT